MSRITPNTATNNKLKCQLVKQFACSQTAILVLVCNNVNAAAEPLMLLVSSVYQRSGDKLRFLNFIIFTCIAYYSQ